MPFNGMANLVCHRWAGLWPDPTLLEEMATNRLVNLSEEVIVALGPVLQVFPLVGVEELNRSVAA
jgi:hypothetical protein